MEHTKAYQEFKKNSNTKFVRYSEGAEMYHMGVSKFMQMAKGIAFVKSRRAEPNVVQMVENMRDQAMPNGVIINDAYCDRSITRDYDREKLMFTVHFCTLSFAG